jgi:hypothetical protein
VSILRSIAFALYTVALAPGLVFGPVYLLRDRFMPYHEAAFGKRWEEVDRRRQILMLVVMKVVGVGMLACAIGGGFLLWGPYREGAPGANLTVLEVVMCGGIPAVLATFIIHRKTGAATPRVLAVLVVGLGLAGFALGRMG